MVNGDVLTDVRHRRAGRLPPRTGAEATIHLTPVEDPSVVRRGADRRGRPRRGFVEKPPADEAPTNLINAGTYVLEPSVLARIPRKRRVSIERETFPALVAERRSTPWPATPTGSTPARRPPTSRRTPICSTGAAGTPRPRRRARSLARSGGLALGARGDNQGTVERSLLGVGGSVGPDATVEDSVVGAEATVEEGASVVGSVLLPGARVGAKATVEGSILGPGAIVGRALQRARPSRWWGTAR